MSTDTNEITIKPLRAVLQQFNEDLGQYINAEERFKLGRVLTIIDASISDPEQRKAIKDLVQNEWWGGSNRPTEAPMINPHADLRGLCLALGFELYPEDANQKIGTLLDSDTGKLSAKKYENAINNRK